MIDVLCPDGIIRKAVIKTAKTLLTRGIIKVPRNGRSAEVRGVVIKEKEIWVFVPYGTNAYLVRRPKRVLA